MALSAPVGSGTSTGATFKESEAHYDFMQKFKRLDYSRDCLLLYLDGKHLVKNKLPEQIEHRVKSLPRSSAGWHIEKRNIDGYYTIAWLGGGVEFHMVLRGNNHIDKRGINSLIAEYQNA